MPFDSLPTQEPVVTNPDVELLDKMIALLRERRCWTKGTLWRQHRDGVVAHCLIGAADAVQYRLWGEEDVTARLTRLLRPFLPAEHEVSTWNDAPERKHREVLDLLRRARERVGDGRG